MLILPDNSQQSRTLLNNAIADRYHITMLVMGNDAGRDVIASKADVRAQALASTRQVVWIRDLSLLSDAERRSFTDGNPSNVVCALSLDDRPVAFLDTQRANSFTSIERAFLTAQQA